MRGFSSASGRNFIKSSRFHTRYMLAVHGSNSSFDPIAPARACSCGYLAPLRSIILRRLSTVSSFAFSIKAQDFTLFFVWLLWVSRAVALDYPTSPVNGFIFRFFNKSSRFHPVFCLLSKSDSNFFFRVNFRNCHTVRVYKVSKFISRSLKSTKGA